MRPSHDTAFTGSTVAAPQTAAYDTTGKPVMDHGGYHTAPTGTGINHSHPYGEANPYGYDNRGTATNY